LHGLYSYHNTQLLVERTSFAGAEATGSWGAQVYGGETDFHNTLLAGHDNGIYFESDTTADTAEVYNVTVVAKDGDGLFQQGGTVTVRNTILASANGRYGLATADGHLSHSYNLGHGFGVPCYQTTASGNDIFKSPRFADAAGGDYHLAPGSPAINSGVDLSSFFSEDLEGTVRPAFHRYEIGAYEYPHENGSLRVLTWAESR
jgi:hypothetical protein